MKIKLLLTLFLTSQTLMAEDLTCREVLLDQPPFYISDEYRQGDKIWENFKSFEKPNVNQKYIPRGSIVLVDEELYEQSDASNHLLPIRVLKTPSELTEQQLKKTKSRSRDSLRALISGISGKPRVKKDDIGWLNKHSIESAGKYTFAVTKDSAVYDSPNVHVDKNYYISLDMEGKKFKATNCCTEDITPGEEICIEKYKMILKDENGNEIDRNYVNINACSFTSSLTPISNESIDAVSEILQTLKRDDPSLDIDDLERLPPNQSWRGSNKTVIRSELIKVPIDLETGKGPFNSFHYRNDDKAHSDAFLKATPLCVFNKVLEQWSKECKEVGCQVQFGDLYHPVSWRAHSSHGSGECIDIRPMRSNDDETINGLRYGWERYSEDKTKRFIELLSKAGGKNLFFNDPKIRKTTKATYMKGHNDHIHVCFPPEDDRVKDTCKNGIKK
ncbi:hypothetical protein [Halobacteriovorax sp. HLS]|uniref:hypothetical protein n=1 Tax=Halobacteriovorax sp. HLS TaxID=2234000 RepID=UPI000FD8ABBB|nr:hypothetical protein [Halobacteriovorax sp. HLS]